MRPCARSRADDSAGNKIAARMAMIAITTSNSIRVKPSTGVRANPRQRGQGHGPEGRRHFGAAKTRTLGRTFMA